MVLWVFLGFYRGSNTEDWTAFCTLMAWIQQGTENIPEGF